jgi:hypothetical protein
MTKLFKTALLIGLTAIGTSCKKSTVDPNVGFSAAVQKVLPQANIDALRKMGMTINEGTVPPNLTGIYLESPTLLLATYPTDTRTKGTKITDYLYKFFEPSADNTTIKVSYKAGNGDSATGLGSVVSGNGNKFTIFSELTEQSGVVYVNIISGELTSSGIKDWQDSYVKKTELEKNSIFEDGDGLASTKSSFRVAAPSETGIQESGGQGGRK